MSKSIISYALERLRIGIIMSFRFLLGIPLLAIAVLALSCSKNEPSQEEELKPAPSVGPASHVAGMWAAEPGGGLSIGSSITIDPGTDPDIDAWQIGISGSEASCVPLVTGDGWLLGNCRNLPYGAWGVSISVPRVKGESVRLRMLSGANWVDGLLNHIESPPSAPESSGVELVWHAPPTPNCGSNHGIWADDGLVFAPCSGGMIMIHDAPTGRLVGTARPPAGSSTNVLEVTYRNGLLYAATTSEGLLTFDVTTPSQPRLVGQFKVPGVAGSPERLVNIHNLTLSGDGRQVYLINQSHPTSDMRIVDVSDPAHPTEMGRYTPGTTSLIQGVHDVYLTVRDGRTYAYVNRLRMGLEIFDVTEPGSPTLVGSFMPGTASHSGWFFEANGQHYFAHTDEGFNQGLTVLNVEDVTKPEVVSVYRKRPGISIHNIRVVDGIAYIAYYVDGLVVLDLRNPEKIIELAHYDTIPNEDERTLFSGAWGVHVDDGTIFISDMDSGIYALQLTEP